MTTAAALLLLLALAAAVADWVAVAATERGAPRLPPRTRWITKPLPLVLLIATAVALEPADPAVRTWFVAALVCSLVGDVALLTARGFVAGLAAFLLAHLAYTGGFLAGGLAPVVLAAGAAAMLAFDLVAGPRLVRSLRAGGRGVLAAPVVTYMAAISVMVAAAAGSLVPAALAGAILFAASDTLLAEQRFVRRIPHGDLAVMVLYHLGQGLLVLSLAGPGR
jgi:uncharacterized membrane protein YhhN